MNKFYDCYADNAELFSENTLEIDIKLILLIHGYGTEGKNNTADDILTIFHKIEANIEHL